MTWLLTSVEHPELVPTSNPNPPSSLGKNLKLHCGRDRGNAMGVLFIRAVEDLISLSCLANGGSADSRRCFRLCGAAGVVAMPALLLTSVLQSAAGVARGNVGAAGALGWAGGRAAQRLACLLFGCPQP